MHECQALSSGKISLIFVTDPWSKTLQESIYCSFWETQKSRIIKVLSSCYDKWRKVVILSREYENKNNMCLKYIYNEFKQYRWYELITYNSKQIQIFFKKLKIGV